MTQLALVFIGTLASVTTAGLFIDFPDDTTRHVIGFAATLLWAVFGMSSFDVIVRQTSFASSSDAIMPLVFVGLGLAAATFIYVMGDILGLLGSATDVDIDNIQ